MPRKRKIKKEPEDSPNPDSGVKRVKTKQKEYQSTPLSRRTRDRELRAAAAFGTTRAAPAGSKPAGGNLRGEPHSRMESGASAEMR